MTTPVTTLFVSAVTDEFGSYRDKLERDLRNPGVIDVMRQENLAHSGGDTLPHLDNYIRQCDAVIHLLGDQTGKAPPRARSEVADLLARHPDLQRHLGLDDVIVHILSRTQWEAVLAVYHGKKLFVACPTQAVARDTPVSDAVEATKQREQQRSHLERLQLINGKDMIAFSDYASLVLDLGRAVTVMREFAATVPKRVADPGTLAHLVTLHARVLADGEPAPLDEPALEAIDRHFPATLEQYHLRQIAHWSRAVHRIDRRFTPLALRLNVEDDKIDQSYDDLRDVLRFLESKHQRALTVFGPPGAGKTTLLRRLGYDLAIDALRANSETGRVPFYAELREFELTAERTSPRAWLAGQWQDRGYRQVGDFEQMLGRGHLLLLLDAVNEMPCAASQYDDLLRKWSAFIAPDGLPAGNQVVFSCRRLDYSIGLRIENKTIPHVEVESLGPAKIREFLNLYLDGRDDLVEATYAALEAEKTFELYNSPFYLTLLVELVKHGGAVPRGRAGLFSAFVRKAVQRELASNRLFGRAGPLLSAEDYDQVLDGAWPNDHDLPCDSGLFAGLAALAHGMQASGGAADLARRRVLRIKANAAGAMLAPAGVGGAAEDMLKGAVDLHILERDIRTREIQFRHQLFQEYFAARKLVADLAAAAPLAAEALAQTFAQIARQPWRLSEISPTMEQELARLSMAERLPTLEPTGWEETFKLAVAMAEQPDALVRALSETNLALAGLAAAQPEVKIGALLREALRQQLLTRSRDLGADLRARIAAGFALGELGDPRLTPGPLPESGAEGARPLLPPFVAIPAGEYPVGVEIATIPQQYREYFEDAGPARVSIATAFEIARFPVTNAEWRRFMAAQGYADPRWWQTDAARAWREGQGTSDATRRNWRFWRKFATTKPEEFAARKEQSGDPDSFKVVDAWVAMDEVTFEAMLVEEIKDQRFTEPAFWRNPAFNAPAQPVVGVCWFEALAYCAWLSADAAFGGDRPGYRLPTEIEREAATGGASGRTYAWGNDWDSLRSNTPETRIKSTTPVGVFPSGDTPEGVSDLSGNVYEWTSTLYRRLISDVEDGREDPHRDRDESGEPLARVVRGASWSSNAVYARAACRDHGVPGGRDGDQGFRVVRVSHP